MAGPYTHLMVIEHLLEKSSPIPHDYFNHLKSHKSFTLHGSIGPDLPAFASLPIIATPEWNKRLHKNKTNATPLEMAKLVIKPDFDQNFFPKAVAWICGYIAHMVTDAVIHPLVNLAVGDYENNKTAHAECETTQDTYIFYKLIGRELRKHDNYPELREAQAGAFGAHLIDQNLRDLWSQSLTNAYPTEVANYFKDMKDAINEWNEGYWNNIGTYGFFVSRHISPTSSYPTSVGMDKIAKYIASVKTPINEQTESFDAIFFRTTQKVKELWGIVFDQIKSKDLSAFPQYIRAWDLDTGMWNGKIDLWQ